MTSFTTINFVVPVRGSSAAVVVVHDCGSSAADTVVHSWGQSIATAALSTVNSNIAIFNFGLARILIFIQQLSLVIHYIHF